MVDEYFRRLGLTRSSGDDYEAVTAVLRWMTASRVPYEQFFFDWFCGRDSEARAKESPAAAFYKTEDFAPVRDWLMAARPAEPTRLTHAYFAGQTLCAMLIDEVETIWSAIADHDDWSLFEERLARIEEMRTAYGFDARPYPPAV